MAQNGIETAQTLYNCSMGGWVGHGFTDNAYDMGLLGDPTWSLCVTCGAWLAIHCWEHLTYHFNYEYMTKELLPLFRGIVLFFYEYLWIDASGAVHSGPSTSPENSYEVVIEKLRQRHRYIRRRRLQSKLLHKIHTDQNKMREIKDTGKMSRSTFVAFSPAIDISVLRHVSREISKSFDFSYAPNTFRQSGIYMQ
jgi:hypothetical protein